jgi:acyl dehydratase
MAFAVDKLDQWSEGPEFKVEAERTKAYAAATNDPIAAHRDGQVAPPVFAVVPIWDTMAGGMAGVVPAEALPFVVHGEQDMFFRKPIVPGAVLRSRAAAIGIHVKPNGTSVVVKVETRDDAGEMVVEQYMTSFFRGVSDGDGGGEEAPGHKLSGTVKAQEPAATVTQQLDDDQTFRYSEASGDTMPMHLDAEFAKSVGLPGIIIHGLCTMAFTSWAAVQSLAAGDSSR